jgi:hypothetical protein
MSNKEWERAALTRKPFTVTYGRDEDIRKFLEKTSLAIPEEKP